MTQKHTPERVWVENLEDGDSMIGYAWGNPVNGMLDEYLLVTPDREAAPELLEALEWMVAEDDTNEGDTPMPDHGGRTWNEINAYWIDGLNKARAAIAKAKGVTK